MKNFAHFILATIRLILLVLYTLLTVVLALPCLYLSACSRKVSYVTAMVWGRGALRILNINVEQKGDIPAQRTIIMPNHQSYVDIFLTLAYSPASIVAKKEIGQWPILHSAVKLGRIILVDRSSLKGSMHAMREIAAEINSGGSVILFPEGGIYKGYLTKPFKSGSFKIAEQTNTSIVPVAIKYTSRDITWLNESFLSNFMMYMGYWKTNVILHFGKAISGGDCKSLMERTKESIDSQLSALELG